MKPVLLCIPLILLGGLSFAQQKRNPDFEKIQWLSGNWTRINVKPGRTGTENWKKVSLAELEGIGLTMRGKDTLFAEKLSIIAKGEDIYYIADVSGSKAPVAFKLTHITDNSFVCENPQHDFPTKIAYTFAGGRITAIVSGQGKSEEYIFVRTKTGN